MIHRTKLTPYLMRRSLMTRIGSLQMPTVRVVESQCLPFTGRTVISHGDGDLKRSEGAYNMVFTQGRGFVVGASFGLQIRSLCRRVMVCSAADTASLAT